MNRCPEKFELSITSWIYVRHLGDINHRRKEGRKEECVFIIGSIVNTEKCQLYMDRCPEGFKSWASNPWPTRSYYAARGHIFKLCIHCNSDTVI